MTQAETMINQTQASNQTDEMIDRLKLLLEEVKGIPDLSKSLSDSTNIIDEIKLDSLEMINFMLKIEEKLKVEIDFEELDFSYLQSLSEFAGFLVRMKPLS